MSQELATTSRQSDLRVLVESEAVLDQLSTALPQYYTPTQFALIVRTQLNKNPKLQECTQESFRVALLTAAQAGIAPDGRNGHLIPRFNSKKNCMECSFQPDYKGLVGLVRKNDDVSDIYAEVVRKNDKIKVTKGLSRDLIHEVDITVDQGEIIGTYAVLKYKDGTTSFEYMSRAEVEAIRARSDSWKAHISKGYSTPWKDDEGEMFKKTAIKRLLKLADLSPDTTTRLEHADRAEIHEVTIERAQIEQPTRPALPEKTEPEAKQVTKETPRTKLAKVVEQQAKEPEPAKAISPDPDPEPEPQPEATPEPVKERAPEPVKKVAATGDLTPAARLATLIDANGFTEPVVVETFKQFFPRQAASITTVDSIPEQVLKAAFLDAESIEELTETIRQNSKA